jgi:hypothetical protein
MLEVIVLTHTMLITICTPSWILRLSCNLLEYPCRLPLQDSHGGRHFLRQTDVVASQD